MREYTHEYCTAESKVNSTGVPIKYIRNPILKAIVYTINKMEGSVVGHLATRPYMALALTCLEPRLYDWCSVVRENLCKKLNACHEGRKKEFGYGNILCSFFFEKVTGLQPRIPLELPPPSVPRMLRWGVVFYRHGGGEGPHTFNGYFFNWWDRQAYAIDDYCLSEVDFHNDPKLVLPPDAQWGRIGEFKKFLYLQNF